MHHVTSRRTRLGRRLAGLTAGFLMLSAPGVAAAQVVAPPSDVFFDVDAKPVLDWSVPSRFDASWSAWNPTTARYDPAVVNPLYWSLNLDGCASTSVRRITRYTFLVEQLGTSWRRTYNSTTCRLALPNTLPAQGSYRVTLTLQTDMGLSPGVSAPANRIVGIRDILIVSMGDSSASGEGNPDVPGAYNTTSIEGIVVSSSQVRAVQWKDRRCHRSASSGPSLAAKAIEDRDKYTSVTFLSVACSGAQLDDLMTREYGGIEPSGALMPPQVDAVAALVGPAAPRGGRQIDGLLISAGINDLHFSDIILRCAKNWNAAVDHDKCVLEGGTEQSVADLANKYDALAKVLRTKLPSTREVYLNNYPSAVFRGGACGGLAFPGKGIDSAEASMMEYIGGQLSRQIKSATDTFGNDNNRWNFVDDLAGPFTPHGYCAGYSPFTVSTDTWFTTYEQSWRTQGNKYGTAHPNAAGHIAYGNLLRQAIVPDQTATPYRNVTVVIESLKATPDYDPVPPCATVLCSDTNVVDLSLLRYQNDTTRLVRHVEVPRNGQWTPVPSATGHFTLDVFTAPASPRHAVGVHMGIDNILPINLTRADGFSPGSHELTHPSGKLAVRYRVVVAAPATGGQVVPT